MPEYTPEEIKSLVDERLAELIKTARIPELPAQNEDTFPLSIQDKVAVWNKATDKTIHAELQALRTLFLTGEEGTYTPPVDTGTSILYTVGPNEDQSRTFNIPELAGKNFTLRRRAYGALKPETEFEILFSGGFKLLGGDDNDPENPPDLLHLGQVYEVDLSQGSSDDNGGNGGGGGAYAGILKINTNLTLLNDVSNFLLQLRAQGSSIVVKLPDLSTMPAYGSITFEASISNSFQAKIETQNGQYIYMQDAEVRHFYIGKGESIKISWDDDGYYTHCLDGKWGNIGLPVFGFRQGLNMLPFVGQLVQRSTYPRLWEEVQSFGASLVDDNTWSMFSALVDGRIVQNPFRGCYSRGNGSTNFRLPDWRGLTIKGLNNIGSLDNTRYANVPGGLQGSKLADEVFSFDAREIAVAGGNGGIANVLTLSSTIAPPFLGQSKKYSGFLNVNTGKSAVENAGVNYYTYC